jgi:hypothetical protein
MQLLLRVCIGVITNDFLERPYFHPNWSYNTARPNHDVRALSVTEDSRV